MATAPLEWPPRIHEPDQRDRLAAVLLGYIRSRRWFRSKARTARAAQLVDLAAIDPVHFVAIVRIEYDAAPDGVGAGHDDDDTELYVVPLGETNGPGAAAPRAAEGEVAAPAFIAPLDAGGDGGRIMIDALLVPGHAADTLLEMIRRGTAARGAMNGELRGEPMPGLATLLGVDLPPGVAPRVEQTNTTLVFGERILMKIYRRLTVAPNPELEIGRFLTTHGGRSSAPRVLGALSYRSPAGVTFSLGIAHEYVHHQGDAFAFVVGELRAFLARVARESPPGHEIAEEAEGGTTALLARALDIADPPFHAEGEGEGAAIGATALGRMATAATVLGRRTGELHLALGSAGSDEPDFVAEPLCAGERRQLGDRVEEMLNQQLDSLTANLSRLAPDARELAQRLQEAPSRQRIAQRLAEFRASPLDVVKIRTHGDLHLGQVLVCHDDLVIIDFEGEPARPLSERRAKSSPLRDVMGLVRSFDYAVEVVLRELPDAGLEAGPSRRAALRAWAVAWKKEVTTTFLREYLTTVAGAPFIPGRRDALGRLLGFHELEKVIYEIAYELNNRPDWVAIPLRGLVAIADRKGNP